MKMLVTLLSLCMFTAVNAQTKKPTMETATLGSGCFWCTEAIFTDVNGVEKVMSGYTGGITKNPTYKEVCSGTTQHAEALQITFNPALITYADILELFFNSHDPTTLNRQGEDKGTQYRSAIFYHSEEQKKIAEAYIKQLNEAHVFPSPIVTEVTKASVFYPAEEYHQNYFALNPEQGYCQYVIRPKVEKFKKKYAAKLKKSAAKK